MTKLKFPKNYKSLSIEEMTFLDGGYRATRQTWIPTQTRRISTSEYTLKSDLGSYLIGEGLSFVTGGTSILAVTASAIASSFFGHGGNAALAREADAKDGSIDGWVTRTIVGHYRTEINPYPPNSYQGAMF